MKNPFALMAAAMIEAFRENKYRNMGIPLPTRTHRARGPVGNRNPAGSKFILRAFKAKHGHKADSIQEARQWYAGYLAEKDAATRRRDDQRKALRTARRQQELKQAA